MESALRQEIMINQFVAAVGCPRDQASQFLSKSGWQFQAALSNYFQESSVAHCSHGRPLITPTNTPVTPPNFPDALTMLSRLSTTDNRAAAVTGAGHPTESVMCPSSVARFVLSSDRTVQNALRAPQSPISVSPDHVRLDSLGEEGAADLEMEDGTVKGTLHP